MDFSKGLLEKDDVLQDHIRHDDVEHIVGERGETRQVRLVERESEGSIGFLVARGSQ